MRLVMAATTTAIRTEARTTMTAMVGALTLVEGMVLEAGMEVS